MLILTMPCIAQILPTHDDVVYATVGGQPLCLDVYLPPEATGPFPVVVWIHGGGWSGGSNASAGPVQRLHDAGIAVASVNYRLTSQAGDWGDEPVIWPAQLNDVKGAVRYLRAHADELGIDGTRIASWGTSAGGHLSAMLAVTGNTSTYLEGTTGGNAGVPSDVRFAIDYFGPSDLLLMDLDVTDPPGSGIEHDAPNSPESRLVGWDQLGQGIGDIRENLANPMPPYPELIAITRSASPLRLTTPDDAPLLIAHGTLDTSVPLRQSERFANACTNAGIPNTYMPIDGAGHGALGQDIDVVAIEMLARYLFELPVSCAADVDGDRVVDVEDMYALGASPRDLDGDLLADDADPACLKEFLRRSEISDVISE